jgi:hypothetical protein
MTIDLTVINQRIKGLLQANTTPVFTVISGNPIALPADGSPFAAYWYEGRTDPIEGPMTLSKRMNAYRYQVRCFWHRQPELITQENFVDEISVADQDLRAAFWADTKLNASATSLYVGDSQTDPDGFFPIQARDGVPLRWYYTLDFEVTVTDLEGEPVA